MIDLDAIQAMADISRVMAARQPDVVAQIFGDRETTYGELDIRASKVANGLIAEGIKPDARVGAMGKNSDSYIEIVLGALKARGVLVGVNWRLAAPEVEYVLNDAKVEILFVGADFADLIAQIAGNVPTLKKIIAIDGGHPEWDAFEDWRAGQSDTDPMLPVAGDDDIIQLYTSGTTGHPKGVQLTNDNYRAVFSQAVESGWADWDKDDVNFVCMPLFHVAGVNVGLLGLSQGTTNVILKDVDPGVIIELIEKHKISIMFLVPAVILFVLAHPRCEGADLSSIRMVVYGASPIAQDLLEQAKARFGCPFTQVYGLTETTGSATYLPDEDHAPERGKLRSCGKPNPGAEIRCVDDDGNDVPQGAVGEILIRHTAVMKGYWNRAEATAEAIDGEGWFRSGDAGYFDEEGYLYIHDRVKDMIVSGGENVYPAEVENALFSHPKVADVAVVGIPSEKWGEAVHAIVVKVPGEEVSAEEVIAFAKENIAGYKVPKSVDFIEVLPRNPSGKVLRRELRAPFWEGRDRQVS